MHITSLVPTLASESQLQPMRLDRILLRLIQGRPLFHRLTTRSLVIGDVPWVSQVIDAYVSET